MLGYQDYPAERRIGYPWIVVLVKSAVRKLCCRWQPAMTNQRIDCPWIHPLRRQQSINLSSGLSKHTSGDRILEDVVAAAWAHDDVMD
jgi:hypothetical protein